MGAQVTICFNGEDENSMCRGEAVSVSQ